MCSFRLVRTYTQGTVKVLGGLGGALAVLRDRSELKTQQRLADAMGVHQTQVTKIESESVNPRASSVDRYLSALGCTLHDLARALDEVNGRPSVDLDYRSTDSNNEIIAKLTQRIIMLEDALEKRAGVRLELVEMDESE